MIGNAPSPVKRGGGSGLSSDLILVVTKLQHLRSVMDNMVVLFGSVGNLLVLLRIWSS
jgi:hypothetical protein